VSAFRLFVIRHGETDWSRKRRFAGSRDIALSPHGRWQCDAVAAALASHFIAAVYASPLDCARTSAEAIARPHRFEVRIEPAFREMAFGEWEGLTRDEVAARFPGPARAWGTSPHLVTPTGGEALTDVAARTVKAVEELRAIHAGEVVVLVTHAIVARLVVLDALGLGPERLWSVDASPAGITEIEYQGGWSVVHRMNTLSHLEPVTPEERPPVPVAGGPSS
jgi:broad specificity phosphatase PhoE